MSGATLCADRLRPPPADGRLHVVDNAKAIGIVLVVAGHTPGLPLEAVTVIYGFHMPLFFFLSGLLVSERRAQEPWRDTFSRNARALLVPYLFFFAVSLGYWLLTRGIGSKAARYADHDVAGAFVGLATGLSSDLFVNPPLWFFPGLLSCVLIGAALRRAMPIRAVALVALVAASVLIAVDPDRRLPWGLDIAWIALVFYASGQALRAAWPRPPRAPRLNAPASALIAALVLLPATAALALWNGRVDLANMQFGAHPWLYLPTAAVGTAMVMAIARACPPSRVARWLSENTLIVFPLHAITLNLASGIVKLGWPSGAAGGFGPGWAAVFVVTAIVTLVPVAWLLNHRAPFLLGKGAAARASAAPAAQPARKLS